MTVHSALSAAATVPDLSVIDDASADPTAHAATQFAPHHSNLPLLRRTWRSAPIPRDITEARSARFVSIPPDTDIPTLILDLLLRNASLPSPSSRR